MIIAIKVFIMLTTSTLRAVPRFYANAITGQQMFMHLMGFRMIRRITRKWKILDVKYNLQHLEDKTQYAGNHGYNTYTYYNMVKLLGTQFLILYATPLRYVIFINI